MVERTDRDIETNLTVWYFTLHKGYVKKEKNITEPYNGDVLSVMIQWII
jgi:hypothetical protein